MTSPGNDLDGGPRSRGGSLRSSCLLAVVSFLAAALVRATPWQSVLAPSGVVFHDGDGYAHMWRIWRAAAHSVPLSARDPFTNFPDGGQVIWPPAFDAGLAFAISVLGLDQSGAELFCAWVPLVLGALAVALAAWLAAHFFSLQAGWLTGAMLAVLPGSFLYTQLGYLDHHAAVTLIGTALLGGAMRIVAAREAGPRAWPFGAGVLAALALSIWSGALLHLLVLQTAMLCWAVGAADRERAVARTVRLALAQAILAVAIVPFSLREWEIHGAYSPLVPSRFQVVWFGAGAACLALAGVVWRWPALSTTRARRLASAAALGALGLVAALLGIPELIDVLAGSASWFTGEVEFLAGITELEPLLTSGYSGLRWGPFIYLSPLVLAFPFACLWLVWRDARPEVGLLVGWASFFFVLTLNQLRFVNTFVVAFCIVMGAAIAPLLRPGLVRGSDPGGLGLRRAGVVALVVCALAIAGVPYYARRLRDGGAAVANPIRAARLDVARFLGRSTPSPVDATGHPTGGLLGSWDAGHAYRYYSGWAVHQDGFGPYVAPANLHRAARYFSAVDETEAIRLLEEMGTRFVIVDRQGAGRPTTSRRDMTSRLVDSRGSAGEIVDPLTGRRVGLPALSRHRLRYGAANGIGGVWLYEIVPGATLVGASEPGALVTVVLQLGTPWGGTQVWSAQGRADHRGEYRIRVPYPTRGGPEGGIAPLGAYRVRSPEGRFDVEVDESAIRGEGVIRVGSPDHASARRDAVSGL